MTRTYHDLTDREIARLLRSESPQGGGAQRTTYDLKCCLRGRTLTVPDQLFARVVTLFRAGTTGGAQQRVPWELAIDVAEALSRYSVAEELRERQRAEAAPGLFDGGDDAAA